MRWYFYVAYFFGGAFLVNAVPLISQPIRFSAGQGIVLADGERVLGHAECGRRIFSCVPCWGVPHPQHLRCACFGSRGFIDGGDAGSGFRTSLRQAVAGEFFFLFSN